MNEEPRRTLGELIANPKYGRSLCDNPPPTPEPTPFPTPLPTPIPTSGFTSVPPTPSASPDWLKALITGSVVGVFVLGGILLNNYLSISRNSPEISQNLQQWLAWDLTSQEWKNIDSNTGRFNPIRTFFGESLPTDIYFASKAGWTSNSRQEVAFVRTRDGKTAYILAAFAEDAAYAKNSQIFPQISRQVFERMNR